jgi:hypothetical protein
MPPGVSKPLGMPKAGVSFGMDFLDGCMNVPVAFVQYAGLAPVQTARSD